MGDFVVKHTLSIPFITCGNQGEDLEVAERFADPRSGSHAFLPRLAAGWHHMYTTGQVVGMA